MNNFIPHKNYSKNITLCNFFINPKRLKHNAAEKKLKQRKNYTLIHSIKKTHSQNINLKGIYCFYGTLKIRAPSCTIF